MPKKRTMLTLPPELVERVDNLCIPGQSRSGFIAWQLERVCDRMERDRKKARAVEEAGREGLQEA